MFSQDCLETVVRHSHDIHTNVAKISHCKFSKFGSDRFETLARTSHDRRIILAKKMA